MPKQHKTALVTGGNRGIGTGVCQQLAALGYHVFLASRDIKRAEAAALELAKNSGIKVEPMALDVTHPADVKNAITAIESRFGQLDVLVNNAGIFPDSDGGKISVTAEALFKQALDTNTFGPLRLMQAFLPLLKKSPAGRVVNVSSGMGQISDIGDGKHPAYRLSKAALNALTRYMAEECKDTPLKINAVCPGWVRTDMGGPNAHRSVDQGAASVVWAATLPADGPTGGFFRDGKPLAW